MKRGHVCLLLAAVLCAAVLLTGCSIPGASGEGGAASAADTQGKPADPSQTDLQEETQYERRLMEQLDKELKETLSYPEEAFTIGYVGSGTDVYNRQIETALQRGCHLMGLELTVAAGDAKEQPELVEAFLQQSVDAIIWKPADDKGMAQTLLDLEESGTAYIILDQLFDEEALTLVTREFPYYEINIYEAGQELGRHAAGTFGGPVHLLFSDETDMRTDDLTAGFLSACGDAVTLSEEEAGAASYAYSCDPETAQRISETEDGCLLVPDAYGLGLTALESAVLLLEGEDVPAYASIACRFYPAKAADRAVQTLEEKCLEIDFAALKEEE